MKRLINEISENYSTLFSLTEANLKTSVESTRLGWMWWFVSPLLMMAVYYAFVGIILDRGGENFHLFILTGLIAWNYFSSAFVGVAGVIRQNDMLLKQVLIPFPVLLLVPVLVQMVLAVCGVLIIMVWNYQALGWHTLLMIPLICSVGLTSYAFGLIISVFTVFVPDILNLLQYILRLGFFLSPVLFSAERVLGNENLPEIIRLVYHLNPMVTLINAFRAVLLEGRGIDLTSICILIISLLLLLQIGLFWIRMNAPRIVKML